MDEHYRTLAADKNVLHHTLLLNRGNAPVGGAAAGPAVEILYIFYTVELVIYSK